MEETATPGPNEDQGRRVATASTARRRPTARAGGAAAWSARPCGCWRRSATNLGSRLFELGQRIAHARGFDAIAVPIPRQVSEHTGEATLMSVRQGHNQLYVQHVEGKQRIQITGGPGSRGPPHATATGKVLVAFAPDAVREQLVDELPLPNSAQVRLCRTPGCADCVGGQPDGPGVWFRTGRQNPCSPVQSVWRNAGSVSGTV